MQNSRAVKYYAYGDQALRRMRIFPHDHPCASIPILPVSMYQFWPSSPVSVITISSQPAENLGFGQPSEDFSCPVAYIHSSISIRISISINTADGQSSASGCIPILSADMFLTEQVKVAAGCGFQVVVVVVVVVSLYNVHSMYSPPVTALRHTLPYPIRTTVHKSTRNTQAAYLLYLPRSAVLRHLRNCTVSVVLPNSRSSSVARVCPIRT